MKRLYAVPRPLCGVCRVPLRVPAVFAQDMERHGRNVDDPILDHFEERKNSVADEFRDVSGYEFDWGLVVAGFPLWYDDDDRPAECVWRITPTSLWRRTIANHRGLQPIHELTLGLYCDGRDALRPRIPGWVEDDHGLTYDLCALRVQSRNDAGRLFGWLEHELLPNVLPPVLRLIEASLYRLLAPTTIARFAGIHHPN